MIEYISLGALAKRLGTYPELLNGLCRFYQVPVDTGPRGRRVTPADAELLGCLLWCWRSRPKLSEITGRRRRRRRPKKAGISLTK